MSSKRINAGREGKEKSDLRTGKKKRMKIIKADTAGGIYKE